MEVNKQRNGQFAMRFIYSLPLGKRFIYNGDKQTEKWAVQFTTRFIFSLPLEKRFKYIMEKTNRNGQFTMRFIYSFYIYGGKQTEKWAVHNEVYIQSSIGETFYI